MKKTIWSDYIGKDYPKLNEDIKTEVLIIGGGISGILCAYYLSMAGKKCVICEADKICNKKTLKTTATITALQDVMYYELVETMGVNKAKMYYEANIFALSEYMKLADKFDFDFEECPSYKYDETTDYELKKEYNILKMFNADVSIVSDIGLPIKVFKALKMDDQGQMNPLKLVNCLSENLVIYEKTSIKSLDKNIAYTENNKIEFNDVVVCTGYPFLKVKGLFPFKLHQKKSHVVAIENNNGYVGNGIGTKDSDIYFRNYQDYLVFGSNDMKTGYSVDGFESINKFIVKNYNIGKKIFRWINEDTVTLDEIPYIGRYTKNSKNMYVCTGYNLWGMTGSMIAANLITDLICGKENKYEELFSPSRKIIFKPMLENIKTAVKGLVSFNKKRCSHLGCGLHYNYCDETYECRCHGSKYDKDGNIIETPAQNKI